MDQFIKLYHPRGPILDVGSKSYKGQPVYRELFSGYQYDGVDIADGPNVDMVVPTDGRWYMIDDGYYRCVISGQAVEHMPFFWETLKEMWRVLCDDGLMCLIVPWKCSEHRYPIDCWRVLPDGMRAISKWLQMELLHAEKSDDDTIGVFRK